MGVPTKLSICLVLLCIGCSDVSKNSYSGFVSDMDTVTFDGQIINFDQHIMIERKDVVIMLLYDPKHERLVLIEHLRPAVGFCFRGKSPWILEFPAGIIDDGESE